MHDTTDDLRIRDIAELIPPARLIEELPRSKTATATIADTRRAIHRILERTDDRLVLVVGPCSIHDPAAAREYAARLQAQRARFADALEIVMRVYFEKPRTTVGWKGLINDPTARWQLPDQRGPAHRPRPAGRYQHYRRSGWLRVSRHHHAAIHRRPGELGRDRRSDYGKPGAPGTRLGPVLPDWLQERHRWRRGDRARCGGRSVPAPSFPRP